MRTLVQYHLFGSSPAPPAHFKSPPPFPRWTSTIKLSRALKWNLGGIASTSSSFVVTVLWPCKSTFLTCENKRRKMKKMPQGVARDDSVRVHEKGNIWKRGYLEGLEPFCNLWLWLNNGIPRVKKLRLVWEKTKLKDFSPDQLWRAFSVLYISSLHHTN